MNLENKNYSKLALGTAQFGMDYGLTNKSGKVHNDAAQDILNLAYENGINTIDTAIAYGDSEATLGRIGVTSWQVITKLPAVPINVSDIFEWVKLQTTESKKRLGVDRLYGILLHRPSQLLDGSRGVDLYRGLSYLKEIGSVEKIGISIYSPDELDCLNGYFNFDLLQTPLNLLDRRIIASGWLRDLKDRGIEIHARSIFLQGLLLITSDQRQNKFDRWSEIWSIYDDWISESKISRLEACLAYVLSNPDIDKVVIGMESVMHLAEILDAAKKNLKNYPENLSVKDEKLLNPSKWSTLT